MKPATTIGAFLAVWLIGLGMGVPLGARYEYDEPLPEPTESQLKVELGYCMATTLLAQAALDSVETWVEESRTQPIAWFMAQGGR